MGTRVVNTHEAKSQLSQLIREAESGTEVIVARNGQPVARIVPWRPARPTRTPGAWRGRVEWAGDIVGSDDEITELFEESAGQGSA